MQVVTELLRTVPPITRVLLAISGCLMALTSLDIISSYSLFFSINKIVFGGEIWRIPTSMLFFGELGVQFCWTFYMMMIYCSKLEGENFQRRRSDFAWILIILASFISGLAMLFPRNFFLSGALISAITYVWGRKNPDAQMTIVFFSVDAPYLPWVLLAISFMTGLPIIDNLIGIIAGHTVFFFDDIYPVMPVSGGSRPLACPKMMRGVIMIYQTISDLLAFLQTKKTCECSILILATTLRLYVGLIDKPLLDYIRDNNVPESSQIDQKFTSGNNFTIELKWKILDQNKVEVAAETLFKSDDHQSSSTHTTRTESSFSLDLSSQFHRNEDQQIAIKSMKDLNDFIDNQIINKVFSGGTNSSRTNNPGSNSGHDTHPAVQSPSSNGVHPRVISPHYSGNSGMLVGPNHPLFRRYLGSRFDPVFPDNPLGVYPPPGVLPQWSPDNNARDLGVPDDLGGDIARGPGVPNSFRGRCGFFGGGGSRGGFH